MVSKRFFYSCLFFFFDDKYWFKIAILGEQNVVVRHLDISSDNIGRPFVTIHGLSTDQYYKLWKLNVPVDLNRPQN